MLSRADHRGASCSRTSSAPSRTPAGAPIGPSTPNCSPLYWRLGGAVLQRQHAEGWRIRVIDRSATDLRAAFPDMRGRSRSNIKYLRQMAGTWTQQARWLSWRRRAR